MTENINFQLPLLKKIFKQKTKKISPQPLSITDHSNSSNQFYLNTLNFNLIEHLSTESSSKISVTDGNIPLNNKNKCKCSKSKCLKLYCECFANGRTCIGCSCEDCLNTEENESYRKIVYKQIIQKNPKAIQKIKSIKKSWTCKCKNSNCQKNYCDCYQNGKFCSSKCKCVDCKNKTKIKKNTRHSLGPHSKIPHNSNVLKKKKSRKVEAPIEAMYTPQKKNYRNYKTSEEFTTAAYTDVTSNSNNKLNIDKKPSMIFKKLNMDIIEKDDNGKIKNIFNKNIGYSASKNT